MQREITRQRQLFEKEAKEGQLDKLCATPFGVDVVGITEFIALTGALVGGAFLTFLFYTKLFCPTNWQCCWPGSRDTVLAHVT